MRGDERSGVWREEFWGGQGEEARGWERERERERDESESESESECSGRGFSLRHHQRQLCYHPLQSWLKPSLTEGATRRSLSCVGAVTSLSVNKLEATAAQGTLLIAGRLLQRQLCIGRTGFSRAHDWCLAFPGPFLLTLLLKTFYLPQLESTTEFAHT